VIEVKTLPRIVETSLSRRDDDIKAREVAIDYPGSTTSDTIFDDFRRSADEHA
jgi:hypothetical protein